MNEQQIKHKNEEVSIDFVTLYNEKTGKYVFAVRSSLYGILCSVEVGDAKTLLDTFLCLGSVVRDNKHKSVTLKFNEHAVVDHDEE